MNISSLKDEAKSFRENQADKEAYSYVNRGISIVPLDRITGSVDRYQDFDERFRIKKHIPSDRIENIRTAIRKGKRLPPVLLFQIEDEYYVLDGNHRVAVAKEFGHNTISAKIVEFIPSKNACENVIYRGQSRFYQDTGLIIER